MEQIAFRPRQMPALLSVSKGTYYLIVNKGLLKFSRVYEGGPRVHLPEHIEEYKEYLRSQEWVAGKGGK